MKHETSTNRSTNIIVCKDAKSPYWIAQFTSPSGQRRRKSTKIPVNGGMFQGERLSAAQAKRRALLVAGDMAREEEKIVADLNTISVKDLFETMLNGKLGRVSQATYKNAATDYRQFLTWLGATRAARPAQFIKRSDVLAWLMDRRSQVRAATCKKALTALRSAFAWAVDAGYLSNNPFVNIKVQPDSREEKVVHEAFTLEEIRLLIQKLPDEWSSAVRCCIGTYGQRLGDILSLRWEQFDFNSGVVRMVTGKTGRVLTQPMMPDFRAWALARCESARARGGDAATWVFPKLRRHTNPSYEFTQLVRLHGIGLKGSSAGGHRRTWHSKTFHSLRASVATMLQAAGVSQGMAMELVGHESAAVHSVYIRPSAEQLRDAAEKLPKL